MLSHLANPKDAGLRESLKKTLNAALELGQPCIPQNSSWQTHSVQPYSQGSKQAKSSGDEEQAATGSDAANTLRHSESTSPLQSLTACVPRPCNRDNAEEPAGMNPPSALQDMTLDHDPLRDSGLAARLSGHAVGATAGQQQQFFQAFQAAVEQHQLAVEACAENRRAALAKFREKRKARNFNKKVRRARLSACSTPCCE